MGIISSGDTHIGMKRKSNQDAIYLSNDQLLFIVADGMGGHNGGDIASALAVEHIPLYIKDNKTQDAREIAAASIEHANLIIRHEGQQNPQLKGMGTTVVSMMFKESTAYISNVGDSRCYLINQNRIFQLTRDHSLVMEKINMGIYNRTQAANDPQKNVLMKSVGFEADIDVDVFNYKVSKNDLFLLCSDGLHGKVSDSDIIYISKKCIPNIEKTTKAELDHCVSSLIAQANANGGQDNISVVMVLAV